MISEVNLDSMRATTREMDSTDELGVRSMMGEGHESVGLFPRIVRFIHVDNAGGILWDLHPPLRGQHQTEWPSSPPVEFRHHIPQRPTSSLRCRVPFPPKNCSLSPTHLHMCTSSMQLLLCASFSGAWVNHYNSTHPRYSTFTSSLLELHGVEDCDSSFF